MNNNEFEQETEITLNQLLYVFLNNVKSIAIITIIAAVAIFLVSSFLITPQYTSTIQMYVNNKSVEDSNTITSGDVTVAQQLVGTYLAIIKSDNVLNEVIESAGVQQKYNANQLRNMITAASVNNTEVFYVTIKGENAKECSILANKIADITPEKIPKIISGSYVTVIDRAKTNNTPVSPNIKLNTLIGALIGFMIAYLYQLIRELTDTKIKTEDDITAITDIPLIGSLSEIK